LRLYAVRLLLPALRRWLFVELGHWRLRWGGIGRRIVLFCAGLAADGRMFFVCIRQGGVWIMVLGFDGRLRRCRGYDLGIDGGR
jgi:hypothetical protein